MLRAALILFCLSGFCLAENQQELGLLLELSYQTKERMTVRVIAAKQLLELASSDRLHKYIGAPLPLNQAKWQLNGVWKANVTNVGHRIEGDVAPARPDVQVVFELAAFLSIEEFSEVKGSDEEKNLRFDRLVQSSTAILGATALDKSENEVWADIRKIVRDRLIAESKDSIDARTFYTAIENHFKDRSKSLKDAKNTLLELSKEKWVSPGVRERAMALIAAKLE